MKVIETGIRRAHLNNMDDTRINLAHLDRCPVPEAKPFLRPVLIAFGWLCVALGLIGVVTPGLPTTVFLIMAAWAFSRSSRRFHAWLYGHKYLGLIVQNWDRHRAIPVKAKIMAVSMMTVSLLIIVLFVAETWVLPAIMLAVLIPAALYIVTRTSGQPASQEVSL